MLKDLTELVVNNDSCVILKVKDNCQMDLISLGFFNGDEKMFRLTKGKQTTCTVYVDNGTKNGTHYSWNWGREGYTLVSDDMRKRGQLIQQCIERDYGIKCLY